MISKKSRYNDLSENVTQDSTGGRQLSKDLRATPVEVTGDFVHTIVENDRLDNLAYRYYKESPKWWRICDANNVMHPQFLLGKGPMASTRFLLSAQDSVFEWGKIVRELVKITGVESIAVEDNLMVAENKSTPDEVTESPVRALLVMYNRLNITAETIAGIITSQGNCQVIGRDDVTRVGTKIVIPPNL